VAFKAVESNADELMAPLAEIFRRPKDGVIDAACMALDAGIQADTRSPRSGMDCDVALVL